MDEFESAKAAFEKGLVLDPNNSQFKTWIRKCDAEIESNLLYFSSHSNRTDHFLAPIGEGGAPEADSKKPKADVVPSPAPAPTPATAAPAPAPAAAAPTPSAPAKPKIRYVFPQSYSFFD